MGRIDSLRRPIERLATLNRSSCSPGEREAAEWIAAALREQGAVAEVELERVHGTYWWPLGLTSALGIAAGLAARRGRRWAGALLGGLGGALVLDDLSAGRRWMRRVLPKQSTANVWARAGDPHAPHTILIVAHHDAAHSSLFFDPRIARLVGRALQPEPGEPPRPAALMMPIAAGPAIAGVGALIGSRRLTLLGQLVCAGIIGSFAEIALRGTVPGANDNLTGVSALIALARSLQEQPVEGARVLLVSTGSEEALMEGMRAFMHRHRAELPAETTRVICVDILGSPHLVLAEAEGMLQVRPYDDSLKDLIASCARAEGVELRRGLVIRFGTDGYLALRHGIPAATLMSVDEHWGPSNYHWPTDTPERVDYETLDGAVRICERVVRALADGPALSSRADGAPQAQRRLAQAP